MQPDAAVIAVAERAELRALDFAALEAHATRAAIITTAAQARRL
jgi:hypothetical protein